VVEVGPGAPQVRPRGRRFDSHVMTMFTSYGRVATPRQVDIIRNLVEGDAPSDTALDEVAAVLAKYRRALMAEA